VRAHERAYVSALGEATVEAWGRSSIDAFERATVGASESARVWAFGEAAVEARDTCFVEAEGLAHVRAFGASVVRAGGQATIEAGDGVSVTVHGTTVNVHGGRVTQAAVPQTAEEWCAHYGVTIEDGVAVLYKAVDDDFVSHHGTSYRPGTEPRATDWDGGQAECGGGLHLAPRPGLALPRSYGARRFVACPVRVADIAIHANGLYLGTAKVPEVCAPVYEVDALGQPV
jgi:hypothetical protein